MFYGKFADDGDHPVNNPNIYNVRENNKLSAGLQQVVARSTTHRREPPTMGKQLVNFITCGCESSAPFFVIYKAGREPTNHSIY
jgi:hypothetical protein